MYTSNPCSDFDFSFRSIHEISDEEDFRALDPSRLPGSEDNLYWAMKVGGIIDSSKSCNQPCGK